MSILQSIQFSSTPETKAEGILSKPKRPQVPSVTRSRPFLLTLFPASIHKNIASSIKYHILPTIGPRQYHRGPSYPILIFKILLWAVLFVSICTSWLNLSQRSSKEQRENLLIFKNKIQSIIYLSDGSNKPFYKTKIHYGISVILFCRYLETLGYLQGISPLQITLRLFHYY